MYAWLTIPTNVTRDYCRQCRAQCIGSGWAWYTITIDDRTYGPFCEHCLKKGVGLTKKTEAREVRDE